MDMPMNHTHDTHSDMVSTPVHNDDQVVHGDHLGHNLPLFLDDMDQGEEAKLLEMLHMPILHGGVREVLLFASLSTDSPLSFALACIVLVAFVTLLELLRLLLWWMEAKYSGSGIGGSCGCKQCNSLTACIGDRKQYDAIHDSNSSSRGESAVNLEVKKQSKSGGWLPWGCVGILQFLTYLISTFLMLIAMTMNIHLIISMSLGSMIGKLTVVWAKKKISDSHQ